MLDKLKKVNWWKAYIWAVIVLNLITGVSEIVRQKYVWATISFAIVVVLLITELYDYHLSRVRKSHRESMDLALQLIEEQEKAIDAYKTNKKMLEELIELRESQLAAVKSL